MIEALILKIQGDVYMKSYYERPASSHKAEITSLQREGGDIAAIWLMHCHNGNVRLAIKNHHVLTVSLNFGFPDREKKHPMPPSKTPEIF
jgi:hypothetical protein